MAAKERALADMGISVVSGGLAVASGKRYLVNLNADPSLNELLVYYLKDTVTVVGNGALPVYLRGAAAVVVLVCAAPFFLPVAAVEWGVFQGPLFRLLFCAHREPHAR